ncbi:MAG TPA: dTDP-4-dehydrorhamnose reductase [Phycisphaerales bacterium]|nr:dTDP-4-dehydrorhamnose reductase [Phycisphaerales bacterium]
MSDYVVIGCNGQIGYELSQLLSADGDVLSLDRAQLDLLRPMDIERVITKSRPRVVINAAAYTAVDRAQSEQGAAHAVNAEAPRVMADTCAMIGAAFVHYSTDYVFDGEGTRPYLPTDTPGPVSVYGATKLAGELAVQASGAKAIILRTAWVYSLRGRNFVLAILRQAAKKPELRVVRDQIGCPTWARSAARATRDMLRNALVQDERGWNFGGKEGIYHVTCSGQTNWFEFARKIVALAPLPAKPAITPVQTSEFPTAARRPKYSVMDCSLTERTFNTRMQPWEEAITEAMREFTLSILEPL